MKKTISHVIRKLFLSIFLLFTAFSLTGNLVSANESAKEVKIYYDRENTDNWDVWLWADGLEAKAYPFDRVDEKGKYAKVDLDDNIGEVSFIVRKNDWSEREPSENKDGSRNLTLDSKVTETWVRAKSEDESPQKENLTEKDDGKAEPESKQNIRIHFDTFDTNYSIWAWTPDNDGKDFKFTGEDDYGPYVDIKLDEATESLGFLVRDPDWNKDVDEDRFVDLTKHNEIYLKSKDPKIYYERPEKDSDSSKNERIVNLTVHFDGKKDDWSLWMWPKDGQGKDYQFNREDKHGKIAEVDIKTDKNSIGFLVKDSDWNKDIDEDRFIDLSIGREIWLKSGDENIYYENPYEEEKFYDKLEARVNYKRYDLNDKENWLIKAWTSEENEAKIYPLKAGDKYYSADISFSGDNINKIYFKLIKLDDKGNEISSDGGTRVIKNFDDTGKTEVWILQDNQRVYYDNTIVDEKVEVVSASIDSFKEINVRLNKSIDITSLLENGFDFLTNASLNKNNITYIGPVNRSEPVSRDIKIRFDKNLELDKDYTFKFYLDKAHKKELIARAVIGNIVASKGFDEKYAYDGKLGPIYDESKTEFKVWAPTASRVDLVIFDANASERLLEMSRNDKGVYTYTVPGDQDKTVYMYDVHFKDGTVNRVVDPYAKSTTINGEKSVVVNPKVSIVERPKSELVKNPIIYELHVRDLSNQDQSGIKNKGKFLGLAETGTHTESGFKTGLDYIADLGVSHIQLLPIYDFSKNSVNEKDPMDKYNWGYDPVNYNSPEGAYSTDPTDPYARINELQTAVDAIHNKGMGVIMDVVYNHVFSLDEHAFNKIVPGYYFRFDENGNPLNGTGVGNETASERKMVSKYIIDSVVYWAETYKLDGFRFDLMGILDFETMNKLVRRLKEINPDIVILGEGWNMGNLPEDMRATQVNAYKMPHVGMFNDDLRDGVKGSVFGGDAIGFVNGEKGIEEDLFKSIRGVKSINGKTYDNPKQLIQYTEAHDNKTSWDKIKEIHPDEDDSISLKRQRLATVIPLLSQGRPFIHAGQEFARTKGGDENSYKSSPEVNELDWTRAEKLKDNVDYIKEVIEIRKNEPLLWLDEFYKIDSRIEKIAAEDGLIAYSLSEKDRTIIIAFNRDEDPKEFKIENGSYKVLIKGDMADSDGLENIEIFDNKFSIEPLSTLMLVKENQNIDDNEGKLEDNIDKDISRETPEVSKDNNDRPKKDENALDDEGVEVKDPEASKKDSDKYKVLGLDEKLVVKDLNKLNSEEEDKLVNKLKEKNSHVKNIRILKNKIIFEYEDGSKTIKDLKAFVREEKEPTKDDESLIESDGKKENEDKKETEDENSVSKNLKADPKLEKVEKKEDNNHKAKNHKSDNEKASNKKSTNVKTGVGSLSAVAIVLVASIGGLLLSKSRKNK